MKPNKIKINLNRTELSADEINTNKRFKPVYDAVRQRSNYKLFTTPKYFAGLLLILGVTVLVYMDWEGQPVKPTNSGNDSTNVVKPTPTTVTPVDTFTPNTSPTQGVMPKPHTNGIDDSIETSYAYSNFFDENKKSPQTYYLNNASDTTIHCTQGTDLYFDKQCFINPSTQLPAKKIKLVVQEFYTLQDIIVNKLSTMCNDKLLETAGMINVTAFENKIPLTVNNQKPYGISFADKKMDYSKYKLFSGAITNGVTEWDEIKNNVKANDTKTDNVNDDFSKIKVTLTFDPTTEYFTIKQWDEATKKIKEIPSSRYTTTENGDSVKIKYQNKVITLNEYATQEYINFLRKNATTNDWWNRIVKKRANNLSGVQHEFGVKYTTIQQQLSFVKTNEIDNSAIKDKIVLEKEFWNELLTKKISVNNSTNLSKAKRVVVSMIYDDYAKIRAERQVMNYSAVTSDGPPKELYKSVSIFSTSKFGFINCDRFTGYPLVNFELPQLKPKTIYAIIYNNIKSVYLTSLTTNRLPARKDITVVRLGEDEFAYAKTFTNNERISENNFTPCTKTEFKKLLADISSQQNQTRN